MNVLKIMKIGKPIHFRPTNENRSACGVEHPDDASYDGRDVDCIRCRRTKSWKVYMGLAGPASDLFNREII